MSTYEQRTLQVIEAVPWDGTVEAAIPILEWVRETVPNALITYDDFGMTTPPRNTPVIRARTKFGDEYAHATDWVAIDAAGDLRVYTADQFDALFVEKVS